MINEVKDQIWKNLRGTSISNWCHGYRSPRVPSTSTASTNPPPRSLARDILPLVNLEVALFARDEGKEGDERENWDGSGY